MRSSDGDRQGFLDHFDGSELDTSVWVPHYLPQWSSRAASAATYAVRDSSLHLTIPVEQGLWCPDEHDPLRVSGVQSGVFSGPVGSTVGQQPLHEGSVVREAQETLWGWTPTYGSLEMRARMDLTPRSMAAWWLVGLEDHPERCGEICVVEVFGDALTTAGAAVGMGVKALHDPALRQDFDAPVLAIDVGEFHTYAVDWSPGRTVFLVDGEPVRTVDQATPYPMQSMIAVFDFPEQASPETDGHVPALVVDYVTGPLA